MKNVLFLILFCIWAFLITVIHTGVTRSGRVVSKLQQEVAVKEARNQYEELEISRLSSPQTVTAYAVQELGLVQAKPHEVIVLEDK